MEDKEFKEPNFTINKVYTRTGDSGDTSLVGGQRLPKDHIRIEAYGEVDELIAVIGGCREEARNYLKQSSDASVLVDSLHRVQHELFNLGSSLATLNEDLSNNMPKITEKQIDALEADIDTANESLSTLHSFVLPGGNSVNIWLHIARNVCRRAERRCVTLQRANAIDENALKYLNRLSDALFVWSRWVNHILKNDEELWNPNI
jgi:cob(I)alamin adenosyltransferase